MGEDRSDRQAALSDWGNRRQPVLELLNSEQRRLHSVRSQTANSEIATQIEWRKGRVKALAEALDQLRQDNQTWPQQYECLTSVPGVGRVVATT